MTLIRMVGTQEPDLASKKKPSNQSRGFSPLKAPLLLLIVASCALQVKASIENEPIRVTNQNSGPRYDIDDVERTRIPDESNAHHFHHQLMHQPPTSAESSNQDDEQPAVRHISLRRIFLVPMSPSSEDDNSPARAFWPSTGGADPMRSLFGSGLEQTAPSNERSIFSGSSRPFWPFMSPRQHHLLGQDEASRPPTSSGNPNQQEAPEQVQGSRTGERESSATAESEQPTSLTGRPAPDFDPMQLMVELLRQALSQATLIEPPTKNAGKEREEPLAKEASGDNEKRQLEPSAQQPPMKHGSKNETREDIVEIEGKKYLRKTVINRHVGENLIFMTKRLIFVPLNETTETTTTTQQPPVAISTTTEIPVVPVSSTTQQVPVETVSSTTTTTERPATTEEATTLAPTSTTQAAPEEKVASTTEQFITTQATPEESSEATTAAQASAGENTREEATTSKSSPSLADTVSDIINKAAERLVNNEPVVSAPAAPIAEPVSSTSSAKPL